MPSDRDPIERIRSFNRFYTGLIGLLDQHFLDSPFSLTEGRVLYEINHIEDCSAKKIRARIAIDEGYLSRIIDRFSRRGLIRKTTSPQDGRLYIIVPTEKGRREFSKLNESSNGLVSQMIAKLSRKDRSELVGLLERVRELLGPDRRA